MKKQALFSLLLLHAALFSIGQQTIVQWNFNTTFSGTPPAPSTGTGTISLIGGVTSTSAAGVTPTDGPTPGNQALNTTTYPGLGIGAKTAGIRISASTVGYNTVHLKYYVRHSNTSSNKVVAQYYDGTTWQDISSYTTTTAEEFLAQVDIDLSSYSILNNASLIQLRLVTDFANGSNYIAANAPSSNYAPSGTIRFDLITVTGNPIGCVNPATQQATGFRLLKTDNTSAQLTLNRGNGGGCLVLCSSNGIPSTPPVSGTNYVANSSYSLGSTLGNAYAVYNTTASNPATQYFNINNLIAGQKYYVAAYEYSAQGYCYLTPAYIDSFYCNSTILYPGDVQFIGYDANDSSGRDFFVITNLKDLKLGTSFQIVNSRFEAGANANVRTNRWYSGGNAISDDIESFTITYNGQSFLPAGSVVSFNEYGVSFPHIQVNGVPSSNISITAQNISPAVTMLNAGNAEQFFITQGHFQVYNSGATNQYSLLDGHVMHGISYTNNWVEFNQDCGITSNRESRLPSDIKCLNLYFPGNSYYGYYKAASPHSGSQSYLLGQVNDTTKWSYNIGTGGNDIPSAILTTQITPSAQYVTATWNGINSNWFNCSSWDNKFVPDSTTDATIPMTSNNPVIDNTVASEYSNQALTRNLTISNASVNLSGASADKLIIYDSLLINTTGSITTANGIDSVIVRSSLQCSNTNGLQLPNGWLGFAGNRSLKAIPVSLANLSPTVVAALSLDNPPGIEISNGGFESTQKLQLASGILSFTSANAFYYMGAICSITSPINYYGDINKGWQGSFIDGKVYMRANYATTYTAPIGSKIQNVFAPMDFYPGTSNISNDLFTVTYNPVAHPNTSATDVRTPPLHHISTKEYWTLTSNTPNASAWLALYYTPYSAVGGSGNDVQALQDLCIAQYWDSSAHTPRLWQTFGLGPYFTAGPNVNYGKVTCDMAATDLRPANSFFTLGTKSFHNTLPVQIITWQAALQNSRTQLHWQVASETDIAFYTIEKSIDGKKFNSLQTTFANGNKSYTAYDNQLVDGWNYYRLKVVDAYGKTIYSTIEKVWNKIGFTLSVFPNPAADILYINLPSGATSGVINIYAADGKKLLVQQTAGTNFLKLNVAQLASGMYLLEYKSGTKNWQQKLLIK